MRGVRRLTVRDLTAFDNQFDGLACYHTEGCLFTDLHLHNNLSVAFRVNNTTCTNHVIIGAKFHHDIQGGLSLVRPGLVNVQ